MKQLELPGFNKFDEGFIWTLEISPQDYADRILALWAHDKTREVVEAARISNLFHVCTPSAAFYVLALCYAKLENKGDAERGEA